MQKQVSLPAKPVVHDIKNLEARLKTLALTLETVRSEDEFKELIRIVHGPGWTTPAEFRLVSGVVESMIAYAKALTELKTVLVNASKEIAATATHL